MEKWSVNYWIKGEKHKGWDYIDKNDAINAVSKLVLEMDKKGKNVTKIEIYHWIDK